MKKLINIAILFFININSASSGLLDNIFNEVTKEIEIIVAPLNPTLDGSCPSSPLKETVTNSNLVKRSLDKWDNCKGKVIYKDRTVLSGNFKKGRLDGFGVLKTKSLSYSGNFKNGKYDGSGKIIFHNGNEAKWYRKYNGNFKNGKFHGYGVLVKEGKKLSGKWIMGELKKKKKVKNKESKKLIQKKVIKKLVRDTYNNKSLYSRGDLKFLNRLKENEEFKKKVYGGLTNNEKIESPEESLAAFYAMPKIWSHNKKKIIEKIKEKVDENNINKAVYEGEYKDGKYHGKGKIQYKDESYYEGSWLSGRYHGKGIYKEPSGYFYDGEWYNGKKSGKGIEYLEKQMISSDGEYEIYIQDFIFCIWQENYKNYVCPETVANTNIYIPAHVYKGKWKNGLREGKGIININYKDSEWRYEYYSEKGIKNGEFELEDKDSSSKECIKKIKGNYKNNLLHGDLQITFNDHEFIKYIETNYKDNKRDGTQEYFLKEKRKKIIIEYEDDLIKKGEIYFQSGNKYEGEIILDEDFKNHCLDLYHNLNPKKGTKEYYELQEVKKNVPNFNKIYSLHGNGVITYANKSRYEGSFSYNNKNGMGKFVFNNGDILESKWVGDYVFGNGKYTFKNGNIFSGNFNKKKKTSVKDNMGFMKYKNGIKVDGYLEKGVFKKINN